MVILLHWMGGSSRSWTEVGKRLSVRGLRPVALDLPGFGEAATTAGFDVQAMADAVVETVQALRSGPDSGHSADAWLLAGHSMGGKVASLVARCALDGETELEGLAGLLLVSPSPPSPEPGPGQKREDTLKLLSEPSADISRQRKAAISFINENVGKLSLPDAVLARTVDDVVAMNRTAFRAWLTGGSLEDWSDRVGTLDLPALVVAGGQDTSLGTAVQRKQTLPHLPAAQLVELRGIGHLAPLECPGELAEHILAFAAAQGVTLRVAEAQPGPAFQSLVASDRTAPQTREAMEQRLAKAQDWNHTPVAVSADAFRTLRALAECIAPDAGFDLAACVDGRLAEGHSDGWRFATLPSDTEAWQQGLRSLDLAAFRAHGVGFAALDPARAEALLEQARLGKLGRGLLGSLDLLKLGDDAGAFTGPQMQAWFEDARAEIAKLYIADPRTMDRIRYTGFADDLGGFTQIRLGEREEFER